jgi:hypothetical protein
LIRKKKNQMMMMREVSFSRWMSHLNLVKDWLPEHYVVVCWKGRSFVELPAAWTAQLIFAELPVAWIVQVIFAELPVAWTARVISEEQLVAVGVKPGVSVEELPVASHYYLLAGELPVAVVEKPDLMRLGSRLRDDGILHASVVAAGWVKYKCVALQHYQGLPGYLFQVVVAGGGCNVEYSPGSGPAVELHNPGVCAGADNCRERFHPCEFCRERLPHVVEYHGDYPLLLCSVL